jgi:hypothetical protein
VVGAVSVLTIERAKWRRGGTGKRPDDKVEAIGALDIEFGPTLLLNDKGLMCCLGFDALACGLSADQIVGAGEPSDIKTLKVYDEEADEYIPREDLSPALLKYYDTRINHGAIVEKAIAANDADGVDDAERESEIRQLLHRLGWEDVVFV